MYFCSVNVLFHNSYDDISILTHITMEFEDVNITINTPDSHCLWPSRGHSYIWAGLLRPEHGNKGCDMSSIHCVSTFFLDVARHTFAKQVQWPLEPLIMGWWSVGRATRNKSLTLGDSPCGSGFQVCIAPLPLMAMKNFITSLLCV